MTEPGVPKLSFDPDEVIGEPADEAAARFVASGFGPVLQIAHEDLGRPRTLEFMPTRVRLGVRDGLVTTVELG
jgi:hypothetical protein